MLRFVIPLSPVVLAMLVAKETALSLTYVTAAPSSRAFPFR